MSTHRRRNPNTIRMQWFMLFFAAFIFTTCLIAGITVFLLTGNLILSILLQCPSLILLHITKSLFPKQ
jgi:Na+/proline symporter